MIICFVRDNGKWCYFRICFRSCWNSNKFCFFIKFWEFECMFMDIYEFLNEVMEINFWLFIEELYNFCSIYRRIII